MIAVVHVEATRRLRELWRPPADPDVRFGDRTGRVVRRRGWIRVRWAVEIDLPELPAGSIPSLALPPDEPTIAYGEIAGPRREGA